jgi:hypothetical protein
MVYYFWRGRAGLKAIFMCKIVNQAKPGRADYSMSV